VVLNVDKPSECLFAGLVILLSMGVLFLLAGAGLVFAILGGVL
jgi:hypothetical protein